MMTRKEVVYQNEEEGGKSECKMYFYQGFFYPLNVFFFSGVRFLQVMPTVLMTRKEVIHQDVDLYFYRG